jgi:hypothetical protein
LLKSWGLLGLFDVVDKLYDMPLRLGYWLLCPFIVIYGFLTDKSDRRRFVVPSGAGRVVVGPDNLVGSFEPWVVAAIREYVRRYPK